MRPRTAKRLAGLALAALLLCLTLPALAEGADAGQTQDERPATGVGVGTGTAVLVGAGAYTFMRGKWQEKKREEETGEKKPYVYFENHTRNGTLTEEERTKDF